MQKKIMILSIAIAIVILSSSIIYIIYNSDKEFNVTVINTCNDELGIFLYGIEDSKDSYHLIDCKLLKYNETRIFHIKIDKSCETFKLVLQSRDNKLTSFLGIEEYAFHKNEVYDLLAIIDPSGYNITITKI